jgi:hypothetical protein
LGLSLCLGLALAACGSSKETAGAGDGLLPGDGGAPRALSGDAGAVPDSADAASSYGPPADKLPPLPAPGDAGVANPVFFGPDNPVIYINDYPRSVYTDGYIYALAANREIQLRGIISSGNDCKCSNGDNYPVSNTPATRTAWIGAAREAGFQNLPDNTNGTQGPTLEEPRSGKLADTVRIGSAGSDLIVREAHLATPERPLLVVIGGGLTTLADAYLADPSITTRVVVSALAGLSADSLDDGNGGSDRWATQIIMRNFRVFLFPSTLDVPYTPEARMMAEFPDTALRDLLLDAGYYHHDYDSDGSPAVTVMLPSFVKHAERRALSQGLSMVPAPSGNLWVMTEGDPIAGGNEFFRALGKAFRNAPTRVRTDAGAADGGSDADGGLP